LFFGAQTNQTIQNIDAYLAFLVVLINFVFAVLILVRTPRTISITFFSLSASPICSAILVALLVLSILTISPMPASAEWFLDVYGGESTTRDASVTAEITSYGVFIATTTKSHTEKVDLDSSFTMGGRLGYWSEKLPWLGVSLDLSYFKAEGEKAEFDVVPLSLLLMLRWPLFKSENFPKGRLQPYVVVGPGYFFTDSRVNFRPALQDSVSGSSGEIGFDARAGLAWQFHKHWAIFGEYATPM
jgi:opacity protein-like surface antigen